MDSLDFTFTQRVSLTIVPVPLHRQSHDLSSILFYPDEYAAQTASRRQLRGGYESDEEEYCEVSVHEDTVLEVVEEIIEEDSAAPAPAATSE